MYQCCLVFTFHRKTSLNSNFKANFSFGFDFLFSKFKINSMNIYEPKPKLANKKLNNIGTHLCEQFLKPLVLVSKNSQQEN